ncbi:MAG: DNA translocase FtsK 4TM domain-containing protein [Fimbriimonadaceae bacterium]
MKVTTRPASTSRRGVAAAPPSKTGDILGVLLLAFALIAGFALAVPDSGVLGGAIEGLLRLLCGNGAWAVAAALATVGVALIAGRRVVSVTPLTWGVLILFLTVLGILARPLDGDFFDPGAAAGSGGYIGAVVGWTLATLLGAAKPIGLGAMGAVGLVLCVGTPIRDILQAIADRAPRPRRPKRPAAGTRAATARAAVQTEAATEDRRFATQPTVPETERRTRPMPVVRDLSQPTLPNMEDEGTPKEGYKLPPLSLLQSPPAKAKRTPEEMQINIETLEGTLEEFGIDANVVEVATGPTVTRYEIQLGPGIKVSRITALADNIAMNLAASHVRVEAPIPGKAAIGVEVPNALPSPVALREVAETKEFRDHPSRLLVALGQDVSGENQYADLTRMPHLLIGGATNSGKSIGLAAIIMSLLLRNTPKDVRFVMIDPKRVELSLFDRIPHLLCPVIRDVKEAPAVLRAVWREMDQRYDKFAELGVRNIDGWNEKASFQDKMPYIVVVIDELADLMIQAAAEVETSICRLAQLARATGIHLVIATQRPSVDVITGTIKANIASRIAFTVSSQVDSRTILDQAGAERLIGRGDMLFLPIDKSKPLRIQGCYVGEKEIEQVCTFWRDQEKPAYRINPAELAKTESAGGPGSDLADEHDPLWEEAVRWVADRGQASTSMLQRRFSIGFQRASRLLDSMEERGIVGPRDGPRPREVLIAPIDVDAVLGLQRRESARVDPLPEDEEEDSRW